MLNQFFAQLKAAAAPLVNEIRHLVLEWTKPLKETLVGGVAQDVVKTKTDWLNMGFGEVTFHGYAGQRDKVIFRHPFSLHP